MLMLANWNEETKYANRFDLNLNHEFEQSKILIHVWLTDQAETTALTSKYDKYIEQYVFCVVSIVNFLVGRIQAHAAVSTVSM